MTEPDGPSTGGGVQAMQHLKLVPPQPNMPTLVVGYVNQRDGTAELRTLHYVDTMCRERFKQGAPLDPAQYSAFVETAKAFLGALGLRVSLASPPSELAERAGSSASIAPAKGGSSALVWISLLVLLGALAAWSTGCSSGSDDLVLQGRHGSRPRPHDAARERPKADHGGARADEASVERDAGSDGRARSGPRREPARV